MDRNEFIEQFDSASTDLSVDWWREVASECVNRCADQYPRYPYGHMNIMSTMEENAEFSEALSQRERGRVTDNYDILQEIGDVLLSILCVAHIYGIPDDDIIKATNVKAKREAGRIEEHKRRKWKALEQYTAEESV